MARTGLGSTSSDPLSHVSARQWHLLWEQARTEFTACGRWTESVRETRRDSSAIRRACASSTLFSGPLAGKSAHFLVRHSADACRGLFLLQTRHRTPGHHLMRRASLPRVKGQRGDVRCARHRQAVAWQSGKSRSPRVPFSSLVRKLLWLRRTAKEPKGTEDKSTEIEVKQLVTGALALA